MGKTFKTARWPTWFVPTTTSTCWAGTTRPMPCFFDKAIAAADRAKPEWSRMPWDARAIIFLKAADLLAGKYRQTLNAATMLNMSKTPNQAEIDAACELIDFWRFNPNTVEIGASHSHLLR